MIQCGARSIRVSEGEPSSGERVYQEYAWAESNWFDGFFSKLSELPKRFRKRTATLILPEHVLSSSAICVPRVSRGKQEKIIRYAVEAELADCHELTWAYSIREQDDIELRLQVFAVKTELAERIYTICRRSGLHIKQMLPQVGLTSPNLLPESIFKENRFRKRNLYLFVGVCFLAYLSISWVLSLQQQIEQRNREYQSFVADFAQLQELGEQIDSNLVLSEQLQLSIDSLLAIESERGRYIRLFSDLQTRLQRVGDTWLEEFKPIKPGGKMVQLSGKMLIRDYDPKTPGASSSYAASRLNQLMDDLQASDYIKSMNELRIDNRTPRILGFAVKIEFLDRSKNFQKK